MSTLPPPLPAPHLPATGGPARPAKAGAGIRLRARHARTRHALLAVVLAATGLLVQRMAGSGAALLSLCVAAGTWLLLPAAVHLATHLRLGALPGAREGQRRRLARAGGVALLLPLGLGAALAAGPLAVPHLHLHVHHEAARGASLLLACLAVLLAGLLDDRRTLRPGLRLLLQAGAGAVLASGGWRLEAVTLGPLALVPGSEALALGLTVAWVVLCTSALRWMDTLEGLSAGLGLVAALVALAAGTAPLAPLLLAGASVGALGATLPPARALGGSSTSLVLGLLLAASTLALPQPADGVLALALLAYPLGDVAVALVRRAVRAKPLWLDDRSHVHHKLAGLLRSRRLALLAVLAFATLLGTLPRLLPGLPALGAGLVAWAGLLALLMHLVGEPLLAMWRHRDDFRRLHAVRPYVTQMLLLSRRDREAREALRRMAVDLRLAWLELPGLGRLHEDARIRGAVEQRIALAHGSASVGSAPSDLPALDRDQRALLGDLLRLAEARLERLRHTRTPPPPSAAHLPTP